jgi:NADH dehydrogenase
VNLTGVLYETGRQGFLAVHAMGSKTVAEAAAAAGVSRFVQVSALGADADSPSKYARSKAEGEANVRAAIPGAVVIRPSVVFGPEDDFLNRFGAMAATVPFLPLVGGGATKMQPVFVSDVGAAIANAIVDPSTAGATYELGGPVVYSFRELMELVLRETGRKAVLAPVPWPIARLIGQGGDLLARFGLKPPLTADQVELLRTDNVCGALPGLAELGVQATAVEAIASTYLYRYRKGGQYADLTATA